MSKKEIEAVIAYCEQQIARIDKVRSGQDYSEFWAGSRSTYSDVIANAYRIAREAASAPVPSAGRGPGDAT